jgi:hypothetical protein
MRARSRRIPHGQLGAAALASLVLKIAASAAFIYAAVIAVVWLAQDRLIFYPQPAAGRASPPPGWRLEDVSFKTRDGTVLAGVFVLPRAARPPAVIYFGGNAEEVTAYASDAQRTYGARAVLFVNYRGYGASAGDPSEKRIVADGIELFDWLRARSDVDGERIAIHGRSLGTGVAVQVAAARTPRCLVLTSPFASARDIAKEIYPWLPVAALLRHPFDSLALAPRLTVPVLIVMGSADTLIAPRHSQALARAWGSPAETVMLEGFGHNDLQLNPRYAESIRAFLDRRL